MTLRDQGGRHVEDTSIFSRDMIVLRKIDKGRLDPVTFAIIGETNLLPKVKENTMPWFHQGFVANDHPRDTFVSEELLAATEGFAVARSDTGEVIREYDGPSALIRAESAAAGARVRLTYDIEMEDSEPAGLPPIPVTALDPEPVLPEEQTSQAPASSFPSGFES